MENQNQSQNLQIHDIMFDVLHCKVLLNNKDISLVKKYVMKFFFKSQGKIFFYTGEKYILYEKNDAKNLIPIDLVKTIKTVSADQETVSKEEFRLRNFLESSEFMSVEYVPTIDFNKEQIFTVPKIIRGVKININYLNMYRTLPTETLEVYKHTCEIDKSIKMLEDHILNVWCAENEDMFEYVMNFMSCTFGGRKLRKCLYLQSNERSGKGLPLNFFNKILGDRMYKTNSVESITKYTKPFEGCVLLNFDELPQDSNSSWKSISDNLKGLITEPTFTSRDMYSGGYSQVNTFNIIITTNNDAIVLTQTNNERYVCLDISEKMIGNTTYFEKLSKAIDRNDVRAAFYNKMMKRFKTLENWNEEKVPSTKSKDIKIIEGLPIIYKYIKERFILKNKSISIKTVDFFATYFKNSNDRTSKNKIGKNLSRIGITPKKRSDNAYDYRFDSKALMELFKKNRWIDELTDVINEDNDVDEDDNNEEEVNLKPNNVVKEDYEHGVKLDIQKLYNEILEMDRVRQETIKRLYPKPKKIVSCTEFFDALLF
jgi:hypothetical protein